MLYTCIMKFDNKMISELFNIKDGFMEDNSDYTIIYKKDNNKLSINIEKKSISDRFKKYIEDLDEDIFIKVCESFEELTEMPLKEFNDLVDSDKLTIDYFDLFQQVVRECACKVINEKIIKYNLENKFYPNYIKY